MTIEKIASATGEKRRLLQRVHELEQDLKRLRIVMKDSAIEASNITSFINQGMTERAAHNAGSLQRKLDVERSSGPHIPA